MPQPHGDTFCTSQTFLTSQRFLTDTATAAPEHIADRAHAIERPVDGEDDGEVGHVLVEARRLRGGAYHVMSNTQVLLLLLLLLITITGRGPPPARRRVSRNK